MEKNMTKIREIDAGIWMPAASHYGNVLNSSKTRYAIFGAGALAVQNIMNRSTVDIDFVVDDYNDAVSIMKEQPNIKSSNLQKDRDGIQVADFYFKSGITVQIWNNNLYSLPMTDESWSRITLKPIGSHPSIYSISMEDLIVSKVGRYTQQMPYNAHEADKNVRDIVATIHVLAKPDYKYVIQRLAEGARRRTNALSPIHNLNWYFVREIEAYQKASESLNVEKIGGFVSFILARSESPNMEYWMLHSIRKNGLGKFKSDFMLDEKHYSALLDRWKSLLEINGDMIKVTSKQIQDYIGLLRPEQTSEYAKGLAFTGKAPKTT